VHIQKRIVGFFHVEGRHTSKKVALTFSEVMVKWYVEKKLFSLTLDNANANEVAVNDAIANLRNVHASLVCDEFFSM
jgi:abortive infection bacteriophage resistance protein